MQQQPVSLSKIKWAIFELRKEIADINGEAYIQEKRLNIYMWKGLKMEGNKTRLSAKILMATSEDYKPVPDLRYLLLLIRDDLLREKQILVRELINKVTNYPKNDQSDNI